MNPDCVFVTQPSIDFRTFLGLTHQVLGRSLADAADASRRELSDAEKFLSCLASLRDAKAGVGLPPCLLSHVSFGIFIGADERDMTDILQCCSTMSFVVTDTLMRGVQAAVVTGTLAQWRDAVKAGASLAVERPVRICFDKIYALFTEAGLGVWQEFSARTAPDQTLYLEDQRRK